MTAPTEFEVSVSTFVRILIEHELGVCGRNLILVHKPGRTTLTTNKRINIRLGMTSDAPTFRENRLRLCAWQVLHTKKSSDWPK